MLDPRFKMIANSKINRKWLNVPDGCCVGEELEKQNAIVLEEDYCYAAFIPEEKGVYAGHYFFPMNIPGTEKKQIANNFLQTMFTNYDVDTIVGRISSENLAARVFTQALGFTKTGASLYPDGEPYVEYKLEKATWDAS